MQKPVRYTEASRTKYPEGVSIAIAKDKTGKPNPITLGWSMTVSFEPPMFAIAVGKTRYSVEAIRHSGSFTYCYPSAGMKELALFFGSRSGREVDKIAESGCAVEPAKEIDSVLLSDAVANFECVVDREMEAGDHIIFTGRVVAAYVNRDGGRRLYTVGPGHKLGSVS
jgi:flavin reductase (DIM6/NTAB) family NADH-FMN oxidoreductase RutF